MEAKTTPAATPTKPKSPTEFVILMRNPKRGTIHALLNPRAGEGALAVFESPEQAVSQTEGLAVLQNKEFFIVPLE